MMHKGLCKILFFMIIPSVFIAALWADDVPRGFSHVYLCGRQLLIERRMEDGSLDSPRVYIIRGVTWAPATRAPDTGPSPFNVRETVPYGFFFDWAGRSPQGHVVFVYWLRSEYYRHYLEDIPLMKELNLNTVRVYGDFGDNPAVYKEILDEFYRNGIMVIMTVVASKNDIDTRRYRKVIKWCKDHPAILMWSLGNEWNLDYNRYWGYKTVRDAAKATQRVAQDVKKMDPFHPVSSCLGDRFTDEESSNTVEWIVNNCPDVEVWGLNIYRGKSFYNLFEQWQDITEKPVYLSEFGIDSFRTVSYTRVNEFQADDCIGAEDQKTQAEYAISLWSEILMYLSALGEGQPCLGGTIHSFNDVLWKVGCYHVDLGGLVNYNDSFEASSYKRYDTEGFWLPGSAPDDVINEEYFGLVDSERRPKQVFRELERYYKNLEDLERRLPE